jgi:hypothetical protein
VTRKNEPEENEPERTSQEENRMSDGNIFDQIGDLVAEERELRERAGIGGLPAEDRERLRSLEERLDQCWDLLRQRRAKEEFGENPNEAHTRPVSEVESYQQ